MSSVNNAKKQVFYVACLSSTVQASLPTNAAMVFLDFPDATALLACHVLLPRLDAIVVDHTASLTQISALKAAYPQAAIIVGNLAFDGISADAFLQAGATDILFSEHAQQEIGNRLMSRIKQQQLLSSF